MFCVRGFGGGVGVSLFFWGVVLACPSCFLGLLGFPGFLLVLLLLVGVGGGLRGVLGFGGWRACFLLFFSWGVGLGVRLRASGSWLSGSGCGRGRLVGGGGARAARFPWWGSGCARFPVRVRGVVVVFAGGFRVLFFSVRCFSCLLVLRVLGPLLGCGFRGVGGLWGVSGWVRGFFLRLLLYWPGPVWVWVGFCLESLILAQDERWRRA